MSESKQREKAPSVVRVIHASEQQRVTMVLFMNNRVQPEGRTDQRRFQRLFDHFDLVDMEEAFDGRAAAEVKTARAESRPEVPIKISDFSAIAEEFKTTADVVEFFLKVTKDKIPGAWIRYLLPVIDQMEDEPAPAVEEPKI